jgi:hypothetical protein
VVDREGDLEDRVGVRLAVLAVHEVGQLVQPPGQVAPVGGQPLLAPVPAELGPLLRRRAGPVDRLLDGRGVVHREDADDGAGGRVGRVEGVGGLVPVDGPGGTLRDRVHLLRERHGPEATCEVTGA